jgi:VWFA-related protein
MRSTPSTIRNSSSACRTWPTAPSRGGYDDAALPLLALLPALLAAQEEQPTFKAEVKVVNVLATVRNKKGAFIRDLGKDDFSVLENGRPQTIRYFSRETDLPLTLGLMIDTSMSQKRVMEAERIASYTFLEQVLREKKDQVFIMQFDLSSILRQELTSSFLKLSDALQRVDTPSMNDLRSQTGGGTMLYDAMLKASKEIMHNQTGRKALIVLSDGVDTGSEASVADAIEAAQKADTLIYSILFSDEGFYGMFSGGADGRNVLMRMSRETGGGFFEVSKKQSLDDIFTQLQEELRSQYNIGYESDQPVSVSEWRKIQLNTRRKRSDGAGPRPLLGAALVAGPPGLAGLPNALAIDESFIFPNKTAGPGGPAQTGGSAPLIMQHSRN